MNALDAIAWYLRFQKEPDSWREHLRAVLDYNEDDCMATKFVKDWLVARSGSENGSAWFRISIVFPLQGLAGMVHYLLV